MTSLSGSAEQDGIVGSLGSSLENCANERLCKFQKRSLRYVAECDARIECLEFGQHRMMALRAMWDLENDLGSYKHELGLVACCQANQHQSFRRLISLWESLDDVGPNHLNLFPFFLFTRCASLDTWKCSFDVVNGSGAVMLMCTSSHNFLIKELKRISNEIERSAQKVERSAQKVG